MRHILSALRRPRVITLDLTHPKYLFTVFLTSMWPLILEESLRDTLLCVPLHTRDSLARVHRSLSLTDIALVKIKGDI